MTHVGADAQRHVEKELVENLRYEVSEKQLGANAHITSAAVSLSVTVMVPPHFGQTQDDTFGAISVDRITGAIPSR